MHHAANYGANGVGNLGVGGNEQFGVEGLRRLRQVGGHRRADGNDRLGQGDTHSQAGVVCGVKGAVKQGAGGWFFGPIGQAGVIGQGFADQFLCDAAGYVGDDASAKLINRQIGLPGQQFCTQARGFGGRVIKPA